MHKSVLVLAAHPDDEVLGCGGTIAKLAEAGARIHIAFLADGVRARQAISSVEHDELLVRRKAAQIASSILGAESVSFGDFPDNRMDTIPLLDITQTVESLIDIHQPDTVFTHHIGDVNIDHRRLHEAVTVACRPQPGCSVRTILSFEVASSTEWQFPGSAPFFSPNWFVDVSKTLARKLHALEAYSNELRAYPHPRSLSAVEYCARLRGSMVGVDAAEAFMLGRRLI